MNDKKMTENEIVKALECHKERGLDTCGGCPYLNIDGCAYQLSKDVIELLNRKNAEIDRLTAVEEEHRKQNGELRKEVERLTSRNFELSEKGEKVCIAYKKARSEAIKETAEILTAKFIHLFRLEESQRKYLKFFVDKELEKMGVEL